MADKIAGRALAAAATAQNRYLFSKDARRVAARDAIDAGCSYREIAEAMNLPVSMVHRLVRQASATPGNADKSNGISRG